MKITFFRSYQNYKVKRRALHGLGQKNPKAMEFSWKISKSGFGQKMIVDLVGALSFQIFLKGIKIFLFPSED